MQAPLSILVFQAVYVLYVIYIDVLMCFLRSYMNLHIPFNEAETLKTLLVHILNVCSITHVLHQNSKYAIHTYIYTYTSQRGTDS